ncbi:hypothetical protein LQZ18_09620 [Lachnospiraceae bacterium ZAX-1]
MNEKIIACFTNPAKCKLMIEISSKKQVTAKQLAKKFTDIPQTSLYRYLKSMADDGVLKIVKENQIRGTVEKVYACALDFSIEVGKMIKENNGQVYMLLFSQYMMGFMQEFREYTSRADIDIVKDCSGFSLAPVYATREELESALRKFGEILAPLMQNEKTPERSLHNIGIITTPPKFTGQIDREAL